MTNLKWEDRTPRSRGGPFEILYQAKATPKANTAPKKSGPKPLAALRDNTGDKFCTHIATQDEDDRTMSIKSRGM